MKQLYKKSPSNSGWRKLALLSLLGLASATAQAQFGYSVATTQNAAGIYTDLGTTGSAITTANTDDDNSAATPIGFTFTFNGTAFTSFVLNTNGYIKLGATAPAAPYYYTGAQDPTGGPLNTATETNLILPFNLDLVSGTTAAEYRVATTGTAPNRVCVIQWKNVSDKTRDGIAPQYDNLSFQAKLYETTNQIEFVYNTATAVTASTEAFKLATVGIKGSGTADGQSVLMQKGSAGAWSAAFAVSGNYPAPTATSVAAFGVRKGILPDAGRTYRFTSPTCPAPTAVTVTGATTTTAVVNFTGSGTSYTIIYGPRGFAPASAGTSVTAAASPATLTGLTVGTGYDVYVRATCSATDQSVLTGPIQFSTQCQQPVIATFPYTESFDGVAANALPCGVAVSNVNNDNKTWRVTPSFINGTNTIPVSNSAPNAIIYEYNGSAAADDWFFTPALSLRSGTRYQLSFKYRTFDPLYPEKLEVKFGSAATPVAQTTTIWNDANITASSGYVTTGVGTSPAVTTITPATTGTYYIGFHVYSATDQYVLALDDISITATTITASSAALTRAISLYPNPTAGNLTVEVRGANAKNGLEVEVLNLLGQRVHTATIRDNMTSQVDLSKLSNGMYLVKVKNGNEYMMRQIDVQK